MLPSTTLELPLDLGTLFLSSNSGGSVYDYICIDGPSNKLVTRIAGPPNPETSS